MRAAGIEVYYMYTIHNMILYYHMHIYTTHGRNNNDNNTVLSEVINGVYTPRGTFGDFFFHRFHLDRIIIIL